MTDTAAWWPRKVPETKPPILLISLEKDEAFTTLFADHLNALNAWAIVTEAKTKKEALTILKTKPQAVICTDGAVARKKHRNFAWQVASFANDGGLVVLGGLFAQSVSREEFDDLIKVVWQLPLRLGDAHRDFSTFNPNCANKMIMTDEARNLPEEANIEAVYVKNVAEVDLLYSPTTYAQGQATAAITDLGSGYVGYVGEVCGEESLIPLYLYLCGLFAKAV
ncbi:MAG: hypothetical protein Q9160_004590 [Pyrenula sp. 1 TL-2023]